MSICTCGRKRLDPVGPENAKILIIGSYPEDEDMSKNMPFVGKRGTVLAGELNNVGIQMNKVRIIFVQQHPPFGDCPGHMEEAIREMKDRDGVLIIGASACLDFGLGKVSEIVGMCVESIYFPKSAKFVMATMNPPYSDFIGEFRLSIEKFAKKLKEVKNG